MEILSDATFRGNVSINGESFSVTPKNWIRPAIETYKNRGEYALYVGGSEFVNGKTTINGDIDINGDTGINGDTYICGNTCIGGSLSLKNSVISSWSDLNNILDFAPKSLSTTVSSLCTTVASNTSKINSACSTISSLCTTVAAIQPNTKHVFGSPQLPVGCTKFYFVNNVMGANGDDGNKHYKFILNKWYDPVSSVQVFKGGTGLGSTNIVNEEVQMDVKQYTIRCSTYGSQRYFEATLASNTRGYDESEFLLVFDDFGVMCTTSIVPQ